MSLRKFTLMGNQLQHPCLERVSSCTNATLPIPAPQPLATISPLSSPVNLVTVVPYTGGITQCLPFCL